jgi:hypothetical protein
VEDNAVVKSAVGKFGDPRDMVWRKIGKKLDFNQPCVVSRRRVDPVSDVAAVLMVIKLAPSKVRRRCRMESSRKKAEL